MAFDAHGNLAYSTVAVAPTVPLSGTSLTVAAGQGALFPAVPFNAPIWPAASLGIHSNTEIVRVTNITGDVLTITRNAETGGTNRAIQVGDQIGNTPTVKTFTDIETAVTALQTATAGMVAGNAPTATLAGTATKLATARTINGVNFDGSAAITVPVASCSDYTTGSWTPVDASGAALSFTFVSATYTKIGGMCFIAAGFTYPATVSPSNAIVGGLPFTPTSSPASTTLFMFRTGTPTPQAVGIIFASLALLYLGNFTTGGLMSNSNAASTNFTISGWYPCVP